MTDLNANVTTILAHLASAFGGHSQVPDEVVGQALQGHFNNNPGLFRGATSDEVLEMASLLISERWEGSDLTATRTRVAQGFARAAAQAEAQAA